jgi:hypothetical protein
MVVELLVVKKEFYGGGVTGCKETVSWWWSYWL